MIQKNIFKKRLGEAKGALYGSCGYCEKSFGLMDWFLREVHIDEMGYVCDECFRKKY